MFIGRYIFSPLLFYLSVYPLLHPPGYQHFVVRTGFEPALGETFRTAHSDANFSRLRCLSISIDLVLTYPQTCTSTCPKSRLGSQDRIRTCNFRRYLFGSPYCVYHSATWLFAGQCGLEPHLLEPRNLKLQYPALSNNTRLSEPSPLW